MKWYSHRSTFTGPSDVKTHHFHWRRKRNLSPLYYRFPEAETVLYLIVPTLCL
jgi:hypothetical protein